MLLQTPPYNSEKLRILFPPNLKTIAKVVPYIQTKSVSSSMYSSPEQLRTMAESTTHSCLILIANPLLLPTNSRRTDSYILISNGQVVNHPCLILQTSTQVNALSLVCSMLKPHPTTVLIDAGMETQSKQEIVALCGFLGITSCTEFQISPLTLNSKPQTIVLSHRELDLLPGIKFLRVYRKYSDLTKDFVALFFHQESLQACLTVFYESNHPLLQGLLISLQNKCGRRDILNLQQFSSVQEYLAKKSIPSKTHQVILISHTQSMFEELSQARLGTVRNRLLTKTSPHASQQITFQQVTQQVSRYLTLSEIISTNILLQPSSMQSSRVLIPKGVVLDIIGLSQVKEACQQFNSKYVYTQKSNAQQFLMSSKQRVILVFIQDQYSKEELRRLTATYSHVDLLAANTMNKPIINQILSMLQSDVPQQQPTVIRKSQKTVGKRSSTNIGNAGPSTLEQTSIMKGFADQAPKDKLVVLQQCHVTDTIAISNQGLQLEKYQAIHIYFESQTSRSLLEHILHVCQQQLKAIPHSIQSIQQVKNTVRHYPSQLTLFLAKTVSLSQEVKHLSCPTFLLTTSESEGHRLLQNLCPGQFGKSSANIQLKLGQIQYQRILRSVEEITEMSLLSLHLSRESVRGDILERIHNSRHKGVLYVMVPNSLLPVMTECLGHLRYIHLKGYHQNQLSDELSRRRYNIESLVFLNLQGVKMLSTFLKQWPQNIYLSDEKTAQGSYGLDYVVKYPLKLGNLIQLQNKFCLQQESLSLSVSLVRTIDKILLFYKYPQDYTLKQQVSKHCQRLIDFEAYSTTQSLLSKMELLYDEDVYTIVVLKDQDIIRMEPSLNNYNCRVIRMFSPYFTEFGRLPKNPDTLIETSKYSSIISFLKGDQIQHQIQQSKFRQQKTLKIQSRTQLSGSKSISDNSFTTLDGESISSDRLLL